MLTSSIPRIRRAPYHSGKHVARNVDRRVKCRPHDDMHATRAARVHRPHSRHHSHMVCYGSSRPRQGGADSHDNEGLGSSSSYDGTSAPVKLLVSGLTAIVNSVSAVFDAGSGETPVKWKCFSFDDPLHILKNCATALLRYVFPITRSARKSAGR